MPQFRKKPVEIEARHFTLSNVEEINTLVAWCGARVVGMELEIPTLEDGADGRAQHVASIGDWIIRGVQGEFYPIKDHIFRETYEEVSSVPRKSIYDSPCKECGATPAGAALTSPIANAPDSGWLDLDVSFPICKACLNKVWPGV